MPPSAVTAKSMRYAIYYLPGSDTLLWRLGCSLLGYDSERGLACQPPADPLLADPAVASLMEEPRRYGFHATLTAPFELRAGVRENELLATARAFAATRAPLCIPRLEVAALGRFLALVPADPCPRIDGLAADCVRAFEPLRAPLSGPELARRLAAATSERQRRYVTRWGYPHVLEEFRFHMTLTGPLDDELRRRLGDGLRRLLEPASGPLAIDQIAILVQPTRQDRFRLIARMPLGARR